jgi:hypothetical protein
VAGDVTATASNLISHETLFRMGVLCHIATTTALAVSVLLLYKLLKPVDNHLSRLMVIPVLVQLPIVVLLEVVHFAALMILKAETMKDFTEGQRQDLAYFLMRMHGSGIGISQIFWGLWLFPFGMLVKKSGALQWVFAALLLLNGIGYVVEGCAFVLLQRPGFLVVRQFTRVTFIGLPITMLWLLVKGIRLSSLQRIPVEPNL